MPDMVTINDQELAILCDILGGWGAKWGRNNLSADHAQALEHLLANGFVELAGEQSLTRYKHTHKASLLLAELCVGVSGG
jgi:hypothetical protein